MSGYCLADEHGACGDSAVDSGLCSCACHLADYDCPGGCGATVAVDNDGALRYCWECDREREGLKEAYLTLANVIIEQEGK